MLEFFKKMFSGEKKENIRKYKIDEDFIEARVEVKDFNKFLDRFKEFLATPDVLSTFRCHELIVQTDEVVKIPVKVDKIEGVGFVENIKVSCGDTFLGLLVVKFIDRRFFILNPALRRKVPPEDVKYLKQDWRTPIEPVLIYLKPDDMEHFSELFWNFVESYSDSYPNPLAARYAPVTREIK